MIWKSQEKDGDYEAISVWRYDSERKAWEYSVKIPACGDSSSYRVFDDDVSAGQTYYYKLEDVELDGDSAVHDSVTVTVPE